LFSFSDFFYCLLLYSIWIIGLLQISDDVGDDDGDDDGGSDTLRVVVVITEFTCKFEMRHSIAGQQDETSTSNHCIGSFNSITDNQQVSSLRRQTPVTVIVSSCITFYARSN